MIAIPATQDPSGYVYCVLLQSGAFSSVKVGSTTCIHHRFTALKNETGAGISCAHIWTVDDCRSAERCCHSVMTGIWKGMRAEWYKAKYHEKIISRIRKCIGKKEDWYFDNIKTDLREYRGIEIQEAILQEDLMNIFQTYANARRER